MLAKKLGKLWQFAKFAKKSFLPAKVLFYIVFYDTCLHNNVKPQYPTTGKVRDLIIYIYIPYSPKFSRVKNFEDFKNFCLMSKILALQGCLVKIIFSLYWLKVILSAYVTGFAKTVLKGTFCISRNTNLKY